LQVGANFDYRLTRWLSLTNTYTTYLTDSNPLYTDARIHRLEVGGFRFNLTKTWVLSAGGGVELAAYQHQDYLSESVSAALGYGSKKSKLEISYHRGFYSILGLQGLFRSDSVNAIAARRITNGMAAKLLAAYNAGNQSGGSASIESISAGGALEFGLSRGLIASLNYSYQHQTSENYIYYNLGLNRYIASVGIQYAWPNRRQ
jgi:hypothetical protein